MCALFIDAARLWKWPWPNFTHYPGIYLEELKRSHKIVTKERTRTKHEGAATAQSVQRADVLVGRSVAAAVGPTERPVVSYSGRTVKLTTQLLLVLRSKMGGAIPQPPIHSFMAYTETTLPLPFQQSSRQANKTHDTASANLHVVFFHLEDGQHRYKVVQYVGCGQHLYKVVQYVGCSTAYRSSTQLTCNKGHNPLFILASLY